MKKPSETKSIARVQTWLQQIENGRLHTAQVIILKFIKDNPDTTIQHIRNEMSISHQTASGRVSTLMDYGLVQITDRFNARVTGSTYSLFRFVSDVEERERLRKIRRIEKQKTWAKYGLENFADLIPADVRNWLDGNRLF